MRSWHTGCTHVLACSSLTSGPRRPMSERRRQPLCKLGPPKRTQRHMPQSLRSRHPARAIAPSRGLFFYSEVQCLDVVCTESRSPAHRADFLAARGTSMTPESSVRSSTLPCAIAADAASTAPFRWRSTSRRSITSTRSRREAHILPETWSRRAPRVIVSRAICSRTSSSDGTRGRVRTSCGTREPCTEP